MKDFHDLYILTLSSIVQKAELNLQNADKLDAMRSATTAGAISAYCQTLIAMGYDVDHGDWEDRGCLRVGYLRIGEHILCKNSVIDYEAVGKAMEEAPRFFVDILSDSREECMREYKNTKREGAKIAWKYTHVGMFETLKALDLISEETRQGLMREWTEALERE